MTLMPTLTPLQSFSILQFSGEKSNAFLQGQLTCDMREITTHGAYSIAAVCDHRGRMLANFWVMRWNNDYLFVLPKSVSETVSAHLKKYALFSKVSIEPVTHFFIAELNNFEGEKNKGVFIPLANAHRYLIIADENPFPDMAYTDDETQWKRNNIADELAILCDKTSLLFTPQMIGLEKWGGVSFNKGCYVGQEIVARTHYLGTLKRHLHRQQLQSSHPLNAGDTLKNNKDETIGVVIEAVLIAENTYDVLAVMQDRAA